VVVETTRWGYEAELAGPDAEVEVAVVVAVAAAG